MNHLKEKFSQAAINETHFLGETTLEVQKENLKEILLFFKNGGYLVLMDLTGVDFLEPIKRTKVVYWLHNPASLERIRIAIFVERGHSLPSVEEIWPAANWYERELWDLFGVKFDGHSDLTRILMPDDWQGHPLLRDYPLTEEPVQFKHDVKPKVPSEIIPYVKIERKR